MHSGQRRDADVALLVAELAVNFVRDYEQVVLEYHGDELFEVGALHYRARRVVRVRDEQGLRLGRYRGLELLRLKAELRLRGELYRHRHAVCEPDARLVGDVARLGIDDLVAGVQRRAECDVYRLAAANREDYLVLRVVNEAVLAVHVVRDLVAQLGQTGVRGVEGAPFLKRVDAFFADVPRSVEVRLADAERDDVGYLVRDVEQPAYAGRLDLLYLVADKISHGITITRWSFFCSTSVVPWSL